MKITGTSSANYPILVSVEKYEKRNTARYMFIVHVKDGIKNVFTYYGESLAQYISQYNRLGDNANAQDIIKDRGEILEFYVFEANRAKAPTSQDFFDIFGYEISVALGFVVMPTYQWQPVEKFYLDGKPEIKPTKASGICD